MGADAQFRARNCASAPTVGAGLSGWRRRAPSAELSGRSDAGPRTDHTSRAVNAVISTAPSMCTSTSGDRQVGEVLHVADDALRELDDSRSRAARRMRPGESVA